MIWLVALAVLLVVLLVVFWRLAFGWALLVFSVLVPTYCAVRVFEYSGSTLAALIVAGATVSIMCPVAGFIVDTIARKGYAKWLETRQ